MSVDQPAKRRVDRERARAWLTQDGGRLRQALAAVSQDEVAYLGHLLPLVGDRRIAQGLAALLVGERYVRPTEAGQGRGHSYSQWSFSPVTLTRKGRAVLEVQLETQAEMGGGTESRPPSTSALT